MSATIPESVRKALSNGGKARARQLTRAERVANGKLGWQTRIKNARRQEREKENNDIIRR